MSHDAAAVCAYAATQIKPLMALCCYGEYRVTNAVFATLSAYFSPQYACIILTDCAQDFTDNVCPVFSVPRQDIHTLCCVSIFIIDTLHHFTFPSAATVLTIPQCWGVDAEYSFDIRKIYCYSDIYCSPHPYNDPQYAAITAVCTQRCVPQNVMRRHRPFVLAPTGSLLGAVLREQMGMCVTSAEARNTILYAPTRFSHDKGGAYVVMLGKILDKHPDYQLCMHPAPHLASHPVTARIAAALGNNPRFRMVTDAPLATDLPAAAVCITDDAVMGRLFAYATLRPELRMAEDYTKDCPALINTGFLVHSQDDILPVLHLSLSRGEPYWRKLIGETCPHESLHLPDVLARIDAALRYTPDAPAADCLIVPRSGASAPRTGVSAWDTLRYLSVLFSEDGVDVFLVTDFYATYPDEPLAMALYCYVQSRMQPHMPVAASVRERFAALGGSVSGAASGAATGVLDAVRAYRDFSPACCRELMRHARLRAMRARLLSVVESVDIMEEILLREWEHLPLWRCGKYHAGVGAHASVPVRVPLVDAAQCPEIYRRELRQLYQNLDADIVSLFAAQEYVRSCRKKVLAFCIYSKDCNPDEFFRHLYGLLAERFDCITLSDLPATDFSMPGKSFSLKPSYLPLLESVDVFLCNDIRPLVFSQQSLCIAFTHFFWSYDYPRRLLNTRHTLDGYDAYCISSTRIGEDEALLQESLEGRCNPACVRRSRPDFYIVGTGYPRLGVLHAQMRELGGQPQDSILYAPISSALTAPENPRSTLVMDYGLPLLKSLLAHFPDYRIVFRPYSAMLKHESTRTIVQELQDNPRFVLSTDTDHKPEFARAAVLITDYSSIGQTFAYSCLRPEIAVKLELPAATVQKTRTGYNLSKQTDIIPIIRQAIVAGGGHWQEHIAKAFADFTVNPAQVFENIVQCIDDLLAGRQPRNSARIRRDASASAWSPANYLNNLFIEDKVDVFLVRSFGAMYPCDGAAFALSLYVAMLSSPAAQPSAMHRQSLQTLGVPVPVRYQDVDKSFMETLFAFATQQYAAHNTPEDCAAFEAVRNRLLEQWGTVRLIAG